LEKGGQYGKVKREIVGEIRETHFLLFKNEHEDGFSISRYLTRKIHLFIEIDKSLTFCKIKPYKFSIKRWKVYITFFMNSYF